MVQLAPRAVRAVRVWSEVAADDRAWDATLQLAATTDANAVVLDLKDESGAVFSQTPSGRGADTEAQADAYDLSDRIADAQERGLYVIVRVVAFQDPIAGDTRPDWAAWDTGRDRPFRKGSQVFLDPWDDEARRYVLDLAVDACVLGADEVQFDYVRFPDGFGSSVRFDGPTDREGRPEAITSFLAEARRLLEPHGCATAAAIFGFITSTPGDGGIGQQLEMVAGHVDVVSPMIYPSHYSTGWFGFDDPNAHPYDVVWRALADGQLRLEESTVVIRPWLQAFFYTSAQIRSELEAAADRGVGWMLWNAFGNYSEASLGDPADHVPESTLRFWVRPPLILDGAPRLRHRLWIR